jgi:hypothetical protein
VIVHRFTEVEPGLLAQTIQERAHLVHESQLFRAQQQANDPHHPEPEVARSQSAHLLIEQDQIGPQLQGQRDRLSLTPIQVEP